MRPAWHPAWAVAAAAAGGLAGLLSDHLTAGPYFNLLAPAFWGLLAWNLAVYTGLAWPRRRPVLRRWLAGSVSGLPAIDDAALARVAALLHAAAAGWGVGLAAGLVGRGLVADYRAGWATTLLPSDVVRAVLDLGFRPARWLLGAPAPDLAAVEALRLLPGQVATTTAAPWIALMVLQLALLVVLPRLGLAALALRQAAARPADRHFWVLPHGAPPSAATVAGLQALLATRHGPGLRIEVAPPLPWGDEAHPPPVPSGARPVLLVDLAATPEAEVHGRLLQALTGRQPLVVADETAFIRRFGRGERLLQRQAVWRALVAPGELLCAAL